MLKLALASLRYRLAASTATFIAVAFGCLILVVCGGIFETALRLNAPPNRLSGAPVVIAGPTGYRLGDTAEVIPYEERARIPISTVTKSYQVPGIARAIPDTSFYVAKGTTGAAGLYGHAWQTAALTPYHLTAGRAPMQGEVVVNTLVAQQADIQSGTTLALSVNGKQRQFMVSGVTAADHTVNAPAFFFNNVEALQFARQSNMVDAVGILLKPRASTAKVAQELRKILPSEVTVLTGDDRGNAEYLGVANSRLPLLLLGGVFSGMVMVVMVLVVSATVGLSVRQRQQELALLRANGAAPRQVSRMILVETMLVALLAVTTGAWLGDLASQRFFDILVVHGLLSTNIVFQHGLIPLGGGAILGLGVTWLTARMAASAAARTRPIQAMAEAAIPPAHVSLVRRWLARIFIVGTVGLAGATMFMTPDTAAAVGGPAVLTGAIAVGLLAPELLYRLAPRVQRLVQWIGGSLGTLAIKNVRSRATQFAAVVTPLTLAVAIALGNIYSQTTQQHAALQSYTKQFAVDLVARSDRGISPDAADDVGRTPGVQAASTLVVSRGWIERPYDQSHASDPWQLLGIDNAADFLATSVGRGSLSDLTGNAVALPQQQAQRLGIAINDKIGLRLDDSAQVNVKVVALLNGSANYASIVVPARLLASHTTSGLASYVLARTDKSADAQALAKTLQRKLPTATVGDSKLLEASAAASLNVQGWINYLVAGLAVAYAAIASVNALVVIVIARRKEFAMQRLVGATRRQVLQLSLLEALIVAVIAIILGTLVSVWTIVPTAIAVGVFVPSGPGWVYLGMLVITLLVTLPVAYIAGCAATKRRPIEAMTAPNE